jgi:peptide/nickel transport system substrate-binding protein
MRRCLLALAAAAALAPPAGAQLPARGGTLKVAIGTGLAELDPALTTNGGEYVYVHLVFNGLTRIDRDMTVKPDLAESWTASADLRSWTFRLRDDVTFQDGRKLDAEDVVATVSRILDPKTGSRARSGLDMVSKVETVDPRTVRFTLATPYAAFADLFADRPLRIVPHDKLAALATAPVGTGPFLLRRFSPGEAMELARNPAYFEKGMPRLDAVELRIIPEAASRLAALESGAVDILWNLPYDSVEKYRNSATVRIDSVPTAGWDGVILNNATRPFDDVRVRQALAATIDKDALVEKVLFGQGAPTHSPIPPSHPYYDSTLGYPAPDIPRARRLLAEAGYPNGIDLTLQVPQEREQRVRLGLAVRDMARAAGFRITVERVPLSSYAARISGKQPIYVDGFFARPTIDAAVYPFFHSGGSWNSHLWHYRNARVDELLDLARGTADEARRTDMFHEYQAIMEQTVPGIIAYAALHVNGVRRTVQNFRSTPMQWLELKDVWLIN